MRVKNFARWARGKRNRGNPRGHKISTADIAKGDGIIKYGERMGHATKILQPVRMFIPTTF